MYKLPLTYKKEDLDKIMFKPLKIYVGSNNSDKVNETYEGEIIKCGLASNPPNLPVDIEFRLSNGVIKTFDFFEIKRFSDID